MYRGWWLEEADRDAETVVDTSGLVFRVTGEYEDGSLELEVVYEDDGYTVMERPVSVPSIQSDYDPAPYDPSTEGPLGIALLGGDDE